MYWLVFAGFQLSLSFSVIWGRRACAGRRRTRRTPEPQNPRTPEPQNHKTSAHQNPRTPEPQHTRTPEPQNPRTPEHQNPRTPEPQNPRGNAPPSKTVTIRKPGKQNGPPQASKAGFSTFMAHVFRAPLCKSLRLLCKLQSSRLGVLWHAFALFDTTCTLRRTYSRHCCADYFG